MCRLLKGFMKKIVLMTGAFIVLNASPVLALANDCDHSIEDLQDETPSEQTDFEDACEVVFCSDEEMQELLEETYELQILSANKSSDWQYMASQDVYRQLTDEEKRVWDGLVEACEGCLVSDEKITKITSTTAFENKDNEYVYNFMRVFRYSNPQYFFLDNNMYSLDRTTKYTYPIYKVYNAFWDGADRKAAADAFKKQIDTWVSDINQYELPEKKELRAIEIICDNTTYSITSLDQSAYSMVCQGKTVCAGYAATFSILMNAVGIDTLTVTGKDGTENHAWNNIKIHDVWYLTDVTWIDNDATPDVLKFCYMNGSDRGYSKRILEDYWLPYYHPSKYDCANDWSTYFEPYFSEGNYSYFVVNMNENNGKLLVKPISSKNSASLSAAPAQVSYKNDIYNVIAISDTTGKPLAGWNKVAGRWRYFDALGTATIGWAKIDNVWYYFDSTGYMKSGWLKDAGKWYYLAGGAMTTGWKKIDNTWYYFNSKGVMANGWNLISGVWYYFDNGAMVKGWKQIAGKWYFFDNGAMVVGWKSINNKWYYFEKNGDMAANKWINNTYYVKANGAMATNEWVDGGRYFVDANGKWVPGKK